MLDKDYIIDRIKNFGTFDDIKLKNSIKEHSIEELEGKLIKYEIENTNNKGYISFIIKTILGIIISGFIGLFTVATKTVLNSKELLQNDKITLISGMFATLITILFLVILMSCLIKKIKIRKHIKMRYIKDYLERNCKK